MKPWGVACCVATIIALCNMPAHASSHILKTDDPQADEIRGVARAFYAKISNGDLIGARALFTGPADQATLLIDEVRLAQSSEKLQAALVARFGEPGRALLPLPTDLRGRIIALPKQYIIVNDNVASISNGGLLDNGLDLQHVGGKWAITHLTNRHSITTTLAKFLTYLADAEDETRRGVEAGTLNTADGVSKDLNPAVQRAIDVWAAYAEPPSKDQVTRPVQPATKVAVPSLKTIRACFGNRLMSADVAALIESLPQTPRISSFSRAVFVISEESGITFYFAASTSELTSVHFAGDGREGMSPYTGELPGGLKFWQTRLAVEQKLGPPAVSSGTLESRYSAGYPESGLQMEYGWCAPKEGDNPLIGVNLNAAWNGNDLTPRIEVSAPRITIRQVVDEARGARLGVDVLPDGIGAPAEAKILVDREVLLDEKSIEGVADSVVGPEHNRLAIHLTMTRTGAKELERISAAHLQKRLAVVLDGQVVIAPVIQALLSRDVVIEMGAEDRKPGLENLAGRLHAAVNALPK